jgi:hypothetical protein
MGCVNLGEWLEVIRGKGCWSVLEVLCMAGRMAAGYTSTVGVSALEGLYIAGRIARLRRSRMWEGLYSCKDGRRIQEAMEVGVPWKDCTGGRM